MAYRLDTSETKKDISDISPRTITTVTKIFKLYKCYFCSQVDDTEEEYLNHSLNNHTKEPVKPDLEMIQTMKEKWGYNIEHKGNPWETKLVNID